jgi:hypothetical protein
LETRGREIEQTQGRDGTERKQRERDAVIATLVLAQAAAEGYANWAHIHAGTPVDGQSWVERWQNLPAAAEAMGRPVGATLADPQCDFLNLLGAWRNALLHADARARDRLQALLAANGNSHPDISMPDLLTVDLAESVIATTDQLFRWGQHLTGVQAPSLGGAWVAADE